MRNFMKKFRLLTAAFILCVGTTIPSWAKPSPVVSGYSAAWFDPLSPVESYNYDTLTHINRSFLVPKKDGSITTEDSFWNPNLERLAHAHGVKLIASIGGASTPAEEWLAMARNAASEKRLFGELEKLITANHYDGVDIDWEPSALTDEDQNTYTTFMKDLRARFPKWIITTALGGGEYWAKHVSWSEIVKQVDFINLMAYDFAGNWAGKSTHDANLYASKNPDKDDGLSDDEIITRLETKYQVPADKIALGVPFYGVQFHVNHLGDTFPANAPGQGTELQYYEIAPLLSGKGYTALWDEAAQVPYLEKVGGGHVI